MSHRQESYTKRLAINWEWIEWNTKSFTEKSKCRTKRTRSSYVSQTLKIELYLNDFKWIAFWLLSRKLVERLDNMKKNASHSISSPNKCALCADYFCVLRSAPNKCAFCHRVSHWIYYLKITLEFSYW